MVSANFIWGKTVKIAEEVEDSLKGNRRKRVNGN
jgi:hypothetical protein